MLKIRTRWLAFYGDHVQPASKEMFTHVEKMIVATLIISAGAHVSSDEPAIVLFGYLRHSLVGQTGPTDPGLSRRLGSAVNIPNAPHCRNRSRPRASTCKRSPRRSFCS